MFIWNEERFAFNIMDAEMLKKFNDTSKEMWKELEEYEKRIQLLVRSGRRVLRMNQK